MIADGLLKHTHQAMPAYKAILLTLKFIKMAFCPAECADQTVLVNRSGDCTLKYRKRNIAKIGFYPCDVDLPSPFTCVGLEALVAANTLTFSSELVNVDVGDPIFEELQLSDCRPAIQIATGRTLTFQDRIAIEYASGSPSTTNYFYDYDFWADKLEKKAIMRYLIVYCDGSVVIPKDENGDPMQAELTAFISQERQGTGGTSYILEIKKGTLNFRGDFLSFNKPELNTDGTAFNLNECSI